MYVSVDSNVPDVNGLLVETSAFDRLLKIVSFGFCYKRSSTCAFVSSVLVNECKGFHLSTLSKYVSIILFYKTETISPLLSLLVGL